MSELTKLDYMLTRENYKVFLWIIVFAMFAYLTNVHLVETTKQSGNMIITTIMCLLLMLVVVTIMLRSISLSGSTMRTWGLRLDRQGWYIWLFLATLSIVLVFFLYIPTKISPSHLTIYVLNMLNLTSQELLFRAFLISYLIKILGTSKKGVFISIILSALLTTLVQKPFLNINEYENYVWLFITGLTYGYIYYYMKSIIYFMYFAVLSRSGDLLPNAPNGEIVYIFGLALLIYLILSITILSIENYKKLGKQKMLELSS